MLFNSQEEVKMFNKLIVGIVLTFVGITGQVQADTYIGYKKHYMYNGVDYMARSTATRKIGIVVDRKHTRTNTGASIKLTFNPRKCIQQSPWRGDCYYGSKRTQLQTHRLFPTNKALSFNFSLWKI